VLYVWNPNTTKVPLCPLHAATGLWCPLCGATRATHALLHGDLPAALHDNAIYVIGLPWVMLLWWRWYQAARLPWTAELNARRGLVRRAALPALIVIAGLFTVIRNLPIGSVLVPSG
jgi:hypothetical protein